MRVGSRVNRWFERRGVSRTLAALAIAQGVAAFGAGLIVPLLAPWLVGLDDPLFPATLFGLPVTTELKVGILFSVFGVVRSIFEIPMGRLSDYFGVRKLFLEIGLIASAFTIVGYALVGTVSGLLTMRILQGFALAISTPAVMAILEAITERGTRGGSMGFYDTVHMLGWGLGPIVGGIVADLFGIQASFLFGAVVVFIAVGFIHVTVPDVRPAGDPERTGLVAGSASTPNPDGDRPIDAAGDRRLDHDEDPLPASNGGHVPATDRADVLYVFSSWSQATTVLGLSLAMVTLMMGFSALVAMENPILDRIGGTKAGFGLIFAITTLVRLPVQFPIGVASDRYGRKRFIVWGLIANVPLVALLGFATSLPEFTLLRGLQGIALAGVVAPAFALAADVVDERRAGEQMAVVTASFSVGFAVGPVLAGALAFLGFAVPFLVAGGLTLLGAVGVWMMVDEPSA